LETQNQQQQEEESTSKEGMQEPQSYAPEFDAWVNEKPRGNFVKLKPGEPKIISFKSGKPNEMLMSNFGDPSKEPKPVARYLVTTPKEEQPNEEKTFDVTSKRLASLIQANYERGFTELEITKQNTTPTFYQVITIYCKTKTDGNGVVSKSPPLSFLSRK